MNMVAQTARTGNTSPRSDAFVRVLREIIAAGDEDHFEPLPGRRTGEGVDGGVVCYLPKVILAGFRGCLAGERHYGSDPEHVYDTHRGVVRVRRCSRKYFEELDLIFVTT